jgi:flagellar basal-body rod protein FlgG
MLPVYNRAVAGMQAAQQELDVNANNIANINTPGFDASDPILTDLAYQNADPRNLVTPGSAATVQGVGSTVESVSRSGQFGQPIVTNNPTDVAITGDGYLRVQQLDGTTAYTRAGMLRLDGQGRFTIDGSILQPPVTLPQGALNPVIAPDGTVTATTPTGQQAIGRIQLVRFPNAQGLQSIGNTLYATTPTAGAPLQGNPGDPGFGQLLPGALEAARVDMSHEMANLIVAERSFTLNARDLQTIDRMVGDVTHR